MQVQAAGAFFGVKPEGWAIKPSCSYNDVYYGAGTRLSDILRRGGASNRNAEPLRAILRQASTSR